MDRINVGVHAHTWGRVTEWIVPMWMEYMHTLGGRVAEWIVSMWSTRTHPSLGGMSTQNGRSLLWFLPLWLTLSICSYIKKENVLEYPHQHSNNWLSKAYRVPYHTVIFVRRCNSQTPISRQVWWSLFTMCFLHIPYLWFSSCSLTVVSYFREIP